MDNNDVDFGEELRQLTRPKSLQKLKGELDYEDWVFTAQGKLEKAGLWHIINTPRPGPVEIDVPADEAEVERSLRSLRKSARNNKSSSGTIDVIDPLGRPQLRRTAPPRPTANHSRCAHVLPLRGHSSSILRWSYGRCRDVLRRTGTACNYHMIG